MIGYIVRRLLDLVFVLLGVSILVFLMVRFIPGDAVEIMLGANTDITPDRVAALRHSLGLDLPIHAQYWRWLTGVLHGDLGTSIWTGRPVSAEILARAPATLEVTGLALLLALVVPFMLCTLGIGLLVSTLSSTQQQAMMLTAFVFMLPQVYLSGFIFPIQNMPRIFQLATYVVPLRYFVVILRGVFLKGVGLATLWPQVVALLVLGLIILTLARLRFHRQLG